jgi:hypothetical protein
MNTNPELLDYSQADIQKLYTSGSISPKIDTYGNLVIQNVAGQMYSSSITIPLANAVFNSVKVETKNDPTFREL